MKRLANAVAPVFLLAAVLPVWAACGSGTKAAPFESADLFNPSKNVSSVALLANKTTLLSFFATWCRPCKEEIPELRALAARYSDRGFQAVLVALDRDRQDVEAFLRAAGSGNLPVLWDPDRKMKELYAVSQLPTNVRIDPDGCVGAAWFGFLPARLQELEAHLKGLPKR